MAIDRRHLKILVTSVGGDLAQSAIRILREVYPSFKIIGIDASAQPFFSKTIDEFYVSPSGLADIFLNWLDEFCIEKKVDLVIPFSESEIFKLYSSKRIVKSKLLIANDKTIEIGLDKLKTNRYLLNLGNFAPKTYDSPLNSSIQFPVVIKERFGNGSKNVQICSNFTQLNFYYEQMNNPMIQQLLSPLDEEITCAIYRFKNGETRVLQMHRKMSGGRTLWAKIISNKLVEELCQLAASDLQLIGAMNTQLILTSHGPKIFEINPRYSSTIEMRHRVGFTDLVWAIDEHFGYQQRNYIKPSPKFIVGRTDQIVVLEI
jgi:carbamoyl-phosphate synthase large subunit